MANLRFKAVQEAGSRQPHFPELPSNKVSDYFGSTSFGLPQMQASLAPDVYKEVKHCIDKGKKISPDSANAVAAAVKSWAIENGITHYTSKFGGDHVLCTCTYMYKFVIASKSSNIHVYQIPRLITCTLYLYCLCIMPIL